MGGRDVAFFIGRNKMRELWNMLQAVFTGIGGWLGYFLGWEKQNERALEYAPGGVYLNRRMAGLLSRRL